MLFFINVVIDIVAIGEKELQLECLKRTFQKVLQMSR